MEKVRIGVIGLGNMGKYHADTIHAGEVDRCELAAVCDIEASKMKPFDGKARQFEFSEEMIRSGEVDAVLVATPHYSHTTIGIDALENGLHLLVEKPISVHKADCEKLIAAHKDKKLKFSAMFNMRTYPLYIKIKELLDSGELGEIRRVSWTITTWFRTEAYYASGGWRATWGGEGGGVLLNQCPHNLDLFQWYFGMPSKLRAYCRFGQYHNIEVEDDVTAYMEYPDGKTAVFICTTGEAPGTNRLEIAADRGKLVMEDDRLTFTRNEIPTSEFNRTCESGFAKPGIWNVTIPTAPAQGGQHMWIVRNFVEAILDGKELVAPAEAGIHSVELANAMLASSFWNAEIALPLDAAAYDKTLKEKIESSTIEKEIRETKAGDFGKSFG